MLLLLPQRYIFSSKSQQNKTYPALIKVVVATTKVHIFKQITTAAIKGEQLHSCCCYHKGTYFQANHNAKNVAEAFAIVVVATTKVHIFKQITTRVKQYRIQLELLLLPQRYIFSSKSQLILQSMVRQICCCCYHKGTYFQANHNRSWVFA